jgi:hypothetical protein
MQQIIAVALHWSFREQLVLRAPLRRHFAYASFVSSGFLHDRAFGTSKL